jgi:thiol-disulfide isomerase/thioredoxin
MQLAVAQTKKVTITGKITNPEQTTPRVFTINFLNPFDNERISAVADADQQFSAEREMLFAQNMTVYYNEQFINLYVIPGDSVHLEIDASKLKQEKFAWLKISGDRAQESTELNLLHSQLANLPYHAYDFSVTVPKMLESIRGDYQRYIDTLERLQPPLNPSLKAFFEKDIRYGIANQVTDYVDKSSSANELKARMALFQNTFFDLGSDDNFVTMMYPYQLAYESSWRLRADSSYVKYTNDGRSREAFIRSAQVLAILPPSTSTDYMLYSALSSQLKKHPQLAAHLPEVERYFHKPIHYQYLKKVAMKVNDPSTRKVNLGKIYHSENSIVSFDTKTDFLDLLAKKHPGKIIYLDVYATWCAPCLQEFQFAPALHKRLKDLPIVFVNVCLQSTLPNWNKLLKERKLQGENYFLDADDSKLLMSKLNIGGFPNYMFIGSDGKVINRNAPRPSEAERVEAQARTLSKR